MREGHCGGMSHLKPFQLLEINVMSGQDLEPVSKKMRTYATAWVHSTRKLTTVVDAQGNNNPTWNDKFVFRVDEEFLRRDTSAVTIEIYAVGWFRDALVGTVRVLVSNLIPPPTVSLRNQPLGMRFAALQVRRPSGRPQGILNVGVSVLNSSMRSMPLYRQLSKSAVGFRDLMDEENLHHHGPQNNNQTSNNPPPPFLRRSRSERSDCISLNDFSITKGSIVGVAVTQKKGLSSSFLSGSESIDIAKGKNTKGKASSVINGAELREKPKEKGKRGKKASSMINAVVSKENNTKIQIQKTPSPDPTKEEKVPNDPTTTNKQAQETDQPTSKWIGFGFSGGPKGSSIVNGKYINRAPPKPHSIWSESVGPSPSEAAAARERERFKYPFDDNESSVLDSWSVDESMEGLKSKLDRWRTELPPLYDRGAFGGSSYRSTSQHFQNPDDGGDSGLFSCFGNFYGYECQCVCGKPPEKKRSLSFSGHF